MTPTNIIPNTAGTGVKADTVAHYAHAVRSLICRDARFPRSEFTKPKLDQWLSAYRGGAGARLKAHAAMSQFAKFLVRRDIIASNPMRDGQRPRVPAPQMRFLEEDDMRRLADAQDEPYGLSPRCLGEQASRSLWHSSFTAATLTW